MVCFNRYPVYLFMLCQHITVSPDTFLNTDLTSHSFPRIIIFVALFIFGDMTFLCSSGYVASVIFLLLLTKYWDYRHSSYLANIMVLSSRKWYLNGLFRKLQSLCNLKIDLFLFLIQMEDQRDIIN